MTNPKADPHQAEHDAEPLEPDNGLFLEMVLDEPDELDWVAERQRREQANLESEIDADLWFTLPNDD